MTDFERATGHGAQSPLIPSTSFIVGIAMFAAGGFWALDVFGLGMMSLLVNRDVITDPRAGVGLGLAMIFTATLALVAGLIRVALRRAARISLITIVGIIGAIYLAYLLGGVIGWILFASGPPVDGIFFALGLGADWPSLVILVNAVIVTLSYFGTLSYRLRQAKPI